MTASSTTADLADERPDELAGCELQLRDVGGVAAFQGSVVTVRCFEDNALVRAVLSGPGEGRVLVVDGGGSLRCALVGDNLAGIAHDNGWAGIIVHGAVRDVVAVGQVAVGVKALGTNPRRAGRVGSGERDVPVSFGGVTFTPGAELFSDEDGVLVSYVG